MILLIQELDWCKIIAAGGRSRLLDDESQRRPLGEQAAFLKNGKDRLTALRRTLLTMQITLGRAIVLRALHLLASRYVGGQNYWFFFHFQGKALTIIL